MACTVYTCKECGEIMNENYIPKECVKCKGTAYSVLWDEDNRPMWEEEGGIDDED